MCSRRWPRVTAREVVFSTTDHKGTSRGPGGERAGHGLGRSGTGKTHCIVARIARDSRQNPSEKLLRPRRAVEETRGNMWKKPSERRCWTTREGAVPAIRREADLPGRDGQVDRRGRLLPFSGRSSSLCLHQSRGTTARRSDVDASTARTTSTTTTRSRRTACYIDPSATRRACCRFFRRIR